MTYNRNLSIRGSVVCNTIVIQQTSQISNLNANYLQGNLASDFQKTSPILTSISNLSNAASGVITLTNGTASLTSGGGGSSGEITITNDTSSNTTYYPLLSTSTSGVITTANTSSTKLYYNSSSGILSATAFNTLSDERLKENVMPLFDINTSLEIIDSLNPVSFTWKDSGIKSYGFIAQELEQVIPEAIENGEYKSVNYSMIIPFLVDSIRELTQELKIVKEKLDNLT